MKPQLFALIHHHRFGYGIHLFRAPDEPTKSGWTVDDAIKVTEIDFEEGREDEWVEIWEVIEKDIPTIKPKKAKKG